MKFRVLVVILVLLLALSGCVAADGSALGVVSRDQLDALVFQTAGITCATVYLDAMAAQGVEITGDALNMITARCLIIADVVTGEMLEQGVPAHGIPPRKPAKPQGYNLRG